MSTFNSLFDAFKPVLKSQGVKPETDWGTTREKIARAARAQLSRRDIKPATVVKWHRLGAITIR